MDLMMAAQRSYGPSGAGTLNDAGASVNSDYTDAMDAKPGLRKRVNPLLLGLTLALLGLLAVIGLESHWLNRIHPSEWTYGDPLAFPGQAEVTRVEVRRWREEDWKELSAESSARFLDALAHNREYLPPKGLQCSIPVRPAIELRLHKRTGPPLRISMSGWCYQILDLAAEELDGGVPEWYARGSGFRTWVLEDQARGVATVEIAGVLPNASDPPDK